MRKTPSLRPELVGKQFGWVEVISPRVKWIDHSRHLRVRCTGCNTVKWINYDNLMKAKTKGCQHCSHPRQIPQWLDRRLTAAKQRCTNPNDNHYAQYGARGIEFRFPSVVEAGLWIEQNLGLDKLSSIDRVDNSGHYEAGNLRWATQQEQLLNTRRSVKVKFRGKLIPLRHAMHLFRHLHPEIRYADLTLRRLLTTHRDFAGVRRQWKRPACKPRGVYGTFSTPDIAIVSQYLAV